MTTPTGILFYDPQQKPLSSTGQFQAGCYLYFYDTGTTSQTDVYADGDLTVPLTQPVTADSAGRFVPIYMDPAVIYRVQLYNAANTKLEDTDPYVVLPIPASIAQLITDVATNTTNIATLTADITELQTSIAWDTITDVPAPIVALGDSSPPDTGSTFWCDNGTWSVPGSAGGSVSAALASDVTGIGNTMTTLISGIPVTAGYSYSMSMELNVVCAGGAEFINTQLLPNSGALTGLGGALCETVFDNATNDLQAVFDSTSSGNAAAPGLTAARIYLNDANFMILRGRFTVPTGCTSVSFQISCTSGTMTAKAGACITLTQIAT